MYYQLADIAKLLNLPESTVRTWRNNFLDFIPTDGQGRTRRYTEESLDVFRTIYQLKQSGKREDEIKPILAKQYALSIVSPETNQYVQRLPEVFQIMTQQMEHLTHEVVTLHQEIANIKKTTEATQASQQVLLESLQTREERFVAFVEEWRDQQRKQEENNKLTRRWWPFRHQ